MIRSLAALVLALPLVGAMGGASAQEAQGAQEPLRIVHAPWSSSLASSLVVAEALESRTGVRVELTEAPVDEAWAAVAAGEQDVFLSAWLPETHAEYLQRYGDRIVDLGPSLEGARTGLMIPDVGASRQTGSRGLEGAGVPDVRSIADLAAFGDLFDRRIVGIEREAGVMRRTREAMTAYGLGDWRLVVTDGEEEMVRRLARAIQAGRPIVVTGWTPLWVHARWSLRFLDDPQGVFGEAERIHTVVRTGLEEDRPEVARALDAFAWTPTDMHLVMTWARTAGAFPRDAARRWTATHEARVASWFE